MLFMCFSSWIQKNQGITRFSCCSYHHWPTFCWEPWDCLTSQLAWILQSIIATASGHSDSLDDKKNDYAGEESETRTGTQRHRAQARPNDDHHLPSYLQWHRRGRSSLSLYWGEPEQAPHLRERRVCLYLSYIRSQGQFMPKCKVDKMAALCVAVVCDSNTCHGQLQTRRKSYINIIYRQTRCTSRKCWVSLRKRHSFQSAHTHT